MYKLKSAFFGVGVLLALTPLAFAKTMLFKNDSKVVAELRGAQTNLLFDILPSEVVTQQGQGFWKTFSTRKKDKVDIFCQRFYNEYERPFCTVSLNTYKAQLDPTFHFWVYYFGPQKSKELFEALPDDPKTKYGIDRKFTSDDGRVEIFCHRRKAKKSPTCSLKISRDFP